jgi:3-deoxy-7-phosphoheptulonate synthase
VAAASRAAIAAGADGLIIETHDDPDKAWSDGKQTITPDALGEIIHTSRKIQEALKAR